MTDRSQVTGHYAGAVTRLTAYVLDVLLIGALFTLGLAALRFVLEFVSDVTLTVDNDGLLVVAAVVSWAFLYTWVSLVVAGRTPGKALVGLRVVRRDGSPLGTRHAFVRVLTFPLAFALFGLGFIGILVGKERRAIYDVLAGTAVVYDWGDRPAELPTPLSRWISRRGAET